MSLFSQDDLAEMFSTGALGTPATFGGNSISVVFLNNYVAISGGTVDIEGTFPVATCRTSDVTGVVHGSALTVDSVAYTVVNVQPGSTSGTTKLVLNEV
jgi:hypothetical protein